MPKQRRRPLLGILPNPRPLGARSINVLQERLNRLIRIPPRSLVFENQISLHAATGKVLHTVIVLSPVSMSIKVPRPGVPHILQIFNEEKRRLQIVGPKPQILVISPKRLIIQINVKKLPSFPSLSHTMSEIQTGHVLVSHFRIHTNHLRMIECRNQYKIMSGIRHVDVPTRLIRLRLQRELISVLLVNVVFAKIVDGFTQPFHRLIRTPASIGLSPFTPTPKHKNLSATFRTQIHSTHSLLHCISANRRIICRKSAITKHRMKEKRYSSHRHN